jgi:hypothetical protein
MIIVSQNISQIQAQLRWIKKRNADLKITILIPISLKGDINS